MESERFLFVLTCLQEDENDSNIMFHEIECVIFKENTIFCLTTLTLKARDLIKSKRLAVGKH